MKAKIDTAIYYIGDEEIGPATKLQKNLAARKKIEAHNIPVDHLGQVKEKHQMPKELILVAHSDDNRTKIGDKTPKDLAQSIANQFIGNKSKLQSVKLVSCEAGFGKNPLALQLVKELHKLGFTNVVVKAATHPKESQIGGVVSITTNAGITKLYGNEDGKAHAVMYGNKITKDYVRYSELNAIPIRNRTPEQTKEMNSLVYEHLNFSGFDRNHPQYCVIKLASDINDFDVPHNIYTKDGVQAELSLDVAITLDKLRELKFAYNYNKNTKAVDFINSIEKEILQNPSMNEKDIYQTIHSKGKKEKIDINVISNLIEKISIATESKRNAINNPEPILKTSTSAFQPENDEAYLDRLLSKDSIFVKIMRFIHGTEDFTNGLRTLLKNISDQTIAAKINREQIKDNILFQQQKDINNGLFVEIGLPIVGNTGFGNVLNKIGFTKVVQDHTNFIKEKDTPIKSLYEALSKYLEKTNHNDEMWIKVMQSKNDYDKNQPKDKKNKELEDLYKKLVQNNEDINSIDTNLSDTKKTINKAIDTYLGKYPDKEKLDHTHKAKVEVMTAIRKYVDNPNETNWTNIESTAQNNPGWDKGFFSKVKFMMQEVRQAHEEKKELDNRPPTPN